jgi:hypothetical protein
MNVTLNEHLDRVAHDELYGKIFVSLICMKFFWCDESILVSDNKEHI